MASTRALLLPPIGLSSPPALPPLLLLVTGSFGEGVVRPAAALLPLLLLPPLWLTSLPWGGGLRVGSNTPCAEPLGNAVAVEGEVGLCCCRWKVEAWGKAAEGFLTVRVCGAAAGAVVAEV